MKNEVGQVIKCQLPNGRIESFKIWKVARKYTYLRSDQFSSDGDWFIFKDDPDEFPMIWRCR